MAHPMKGQARVYQSSNLDYDKVDTAEEKQKIFIKSLGSREEAFKVLENSQLVLNPAAYMRTLNVIDSIFPPAGELQ